MKFKNPFKALSVGELTLWLCSFLAVALSFVLSPERDVISLVASLIGVTALIFIAKGMVIGQVLTVVFAILYGIASYTFAYYGEMITYLCMSAPAAIVAIISWVRNPYSDSGTVHVAKRLSRGSVLLTLTLTVSLTVAFYFILGALGTANLVTSTVSVTTSLLASLLVILRSPYYAIAYAANDVVLIVLWTMASIEDIGYLPMIICFVAFLANDLYAFGNWRKMRREQNG